jgi:Na+/proline symporter
MADCSYHPGKDAVGACVSCGKMVCLACRTELQEKVYCQPCANKLFVSKSEVQPARVETAPVVHSVSGWWWLLPIFFTWLGGLIAWAVTKDKDPKKARSMLILGIVLAVILVVLTVAFIALFVLGFLSIEGMELE